MADSSLLLKMTDDAELGMHWFRVLVEVDGPMPYRGFHVYARDEDGVKAAIGDLKLKAMKRCFSDDAVVRSH